MDHDNINNESVPVDQMGLLNINVNEMLLPPEESYVEDCSSNSANLASPNSNGQGDSANSQEVFGESPHHEKDSKDSEKLKGACKKKKKKRVVSNPKEERLNKHNIKLLQGSEFLGPSLKSLTIDSDAYKMKNKKRGKCLIFNHKIFDKHTRLSERPGTDVDAARLEKIFQKLQFDVTRYNDLTVIEILEILNCVSKEDHSNYDCFACCVLTHGENGILYGRNGKYGNELFLTPFSGECPTLDGKPKLFFFQACQGHKLDHGVHVETVEDTKKISVPADSCVDDIDDSAENKLPINIDYLIAYATIPGYYSTRNPTKGSWFIRALVSVLDECADKVDLLSMLTRVNKKVSYKFQSFVPEDRKFHEKKQVPCVTSMLTGKVYLRPGSREKVKAGVVENSKEENSIDEHDANNLAHRKALLTKSVQKSVAILTTSPESHVYNMGHKNRGKCIIFDNRVFEGHNPLKKCHRTERDAEKLRKKFEELYFSVEVHNDLTHFQILNILTAVAQEDHSQNDCFACCILTHGDNRVLYGTTGQYGNNEFCGPFRGDECLTLVGKPKLFFIQECECHKVFGCGENVDTVDSSTDLKIPVYADFLITHFTIPCHCSWYTTEGSWFINAMVSVLDEYSDTNTMDLLSMLTRINHIVAYDFPYDFIIDKKQVPSCITSMLTAEVYFLPKN